MDFEVVAAASQLAGLSGEWNRLPAPSPMQSAAWLKTWWDAYGDESRELLVVVGREGDKLVGVAPWYVQVVGNRRVIRWLGDGRVCSDHATLLTHSAHETRFAEALAEWLCEQGDFDWDVIRLEAVDSDDATCARFVERLVRIGCSAVEPEEPGSCYVPLPATFDEYLMSISKNHRKRCRKWEKLYFQSGRAKLRTATSPDDCLAQWQTLVDLHNARRTGLGQEGAFADPRFFDFHRRVLPRLASEGRVLLRTLELDGVPAAAEYVLRKGRSWYAYQSGLSEAGQLQSAGNLSILALVKDAIAAGCGRLDLLRGVEPYKFSWGGVHRPARSLVVRRPHSLGRILTLRDSAWLTAKRLRRSLVHNG